MFDSAQDTANALGVVVFVIALWVVVRFVDRGK